jgi:hypothetical protein
MAQSKQQKLQEMAASGNKNSILEAFQAKEADAKERLRRTFVAYVKYPFSMKTGSMKGLPAGYIVFGSDNGIGSFMNQNFGAFFVGKPNSQVAEMSDLMRSINDSIRRRFSAADVQSTVVLRIVSNYFRFILEDYFEPRAMAIETLYIDVLGMCRWSSFDGEHGSIDMASRGHDVIIRGCYDEPLKKRVERYLRGNLLKRKRAPNAKTQAKIKRELKAITGLRYIKIVSLDT